MTLKDQLANDSSLVFCNSNEFAETVTYKPHNHVGRTVRQNRNIIAVVERETISVLSQDGEHVIPQFTLHLANSSTLGITSSEIDVGRDRIAIAERIGDVATDRTVTRLQENDEGMLVIECR